MRKLWPLAVLWLWAGCASSPVKPAEPTVNLEPADARRREGCYDCLLEARDQYQRAAAGPTRPLALRRWFETELLIALREREFGIDNTVSIARARTLSAELPADVNAGRYVDDVDWVPNSGGWSRKATAEFLAAHAASPAKVDEETAWIRAGALDPMVAEYVATALDCGYRNRPRPPGQRQPPPPAIPSEASPLVRYRLAWCGQMQLRALDAVRAEVPDFVETSYFQGVVAVNGIERGGGPNPHTLVAEVLKRFDASPAVTFLAGNLYQAVGDCEKALSAFERTIALQPLHEDAWLGRATCLTDLAKPAEAIAATTAMIERGLDNVDQAYYWRAWNRHGLGELVAARADIDAARIRRVTGAIFTLAGVIEHDQDDAKKALGDLNQAIQIDQGNCRAWWYQGSTLVKLEQWREAASTFDRAMTCFERDVLVRQGLLEQTEANPALDPDYKRARAARLREQIESQRHSQYSAAFNAANFYFWMGNVERTLTLIEVAAKAPELEADVARLRQQMAEKTARANGPA